MKRVIYHQGKRMIKKKVNKKKVFGLILVIAIIAFSIVYASKEKEDENENTIDTSSQVTNNTQDANIISEENVVDDKKYEDVDIPEKLGGYDVMGQLVIEKIRCKTKCFKQNRKCFIEIRGN